MPKYASDYPETDLGNAELFAAMYAEQLRFDHGRQRWHVWSAGFWRDDRDGNVIRLAKAAVRERLRAAAMIPDEKERKRAVSWARRSESRSRIDAAIELAKSQRPIADTGEGWDEQPMLLGVSNGVVDLRSGKIRPGQRKDRMTMFTDVRFDLNAECPRFMRFLSEVFRGDEELIRFVQKSIGYSLSGDVSEQCIFLCYGDGANGKTTFLEAIRGGMGPYAFNLPFSAFELARPSSIPNEVAAIAGRRFVTAVETSEDVRLNEGRVKALTGGDRCTARFLYREFFEFRPTAKFWVAFNHKPRVSDDSHGFWRRIRLIPFMATFAESECDKNLLQKLEAERSGILAWAVRGCLMWQAEGLGLPQVVANATRTYREESDLIAEFVAERCKVDPNMSVVVSVLREAYEDWAKENGEKPLDNRTFSGRLRAKGFEQVRKGHERKRWWKGLGRIPSEEFRPLAKPFTPPSADVRTGEDAKTQ